MRLVQIFTQFQALFQELTYKRVWTMMTVDLESMEINLWFDARKASIYRVNDPITHAGVGLGKSFCGVNLYVWWESWICINSVEVVSCKKCRKIVKKIEEEMKREKYAQDYHSDYLNKFRKQGVTK